MTRGKRKNQPNTRLGELNVWVNVTYPHSPLYGKKIYVVRVKHGVHTDLFAELPDGERVKIDARWTDYLELSDKTPPVSHYLDVPSVQQIAKVVNDLKSREAEPLINEDETKR